MRSSYVIFGMVATMSAASAGVGTWQGTLKPGQSLVAKHEQALQAGRTRFVMQRDCNLVVYHSGKAVWATNTDKQGSGCVAVMQGDGNLVLLRGDGKVLWASHTDHHPGAWVKVQYDGNVVIYPPQTEDNPHTPPGLPYGRALWATNTVAYR